MPDFPAWQQGVRPHYPTLQNHIRCDAAVIGGGLTGVTTAAMLASVGCRVVLLESRQLGCGATFACTGKVTAMQPEVLARVRQCAGLRAAQAYGRLLTRTVSDIRSMVEELRIPCAHMPQEVMLYARDRRSQRLLQSETDKLNRCGVRASLLPAGTRLPLRLEQAAWLTGQLRLMPLPYLFALAEHARAHGCLLYEHTPVLHLDGQHAVTPNGSVSADTIILATGAPLLMKQLSILALTPQHMLEERVLSHTPPLRTSLVDVRQDGLALLPALGGMVATCDLGPTGTRHSAAIRRMDDQLRSLASQAHTVQRFFRADVFPPDGLPLVGPVRRHDPHLLMACGYSGWGMTGSFLAASTLARLVLEKPCPEASLLSPHRRYRGHMLTVLRGSKQPASAYLRSALHLSAPTCPHMRCKLRYSTATGRWECPCHGSCFDDFGACERTPAATDAKTSIAQRREHHIN